MTILSFDEINKLVENKRSIPYGKYFGEMEISYKQKENRIKLAFLFEELFLYPMIYMLSLRNYNVSDWNRAKKLFEDAYTEAIDHGGYSTDNYIEKHIEEFADEIVESTKRNKDDPYFFSKDRIKVLSENESNTYYNNKEHKEAIESGYSKKQWIAIMDMVTRDDHVTVNKKTIPINDLFLVGDSLMLFPKDLSRDPSPDQVVNCRCSVKYIR